jgi:GAF domain-containing protein
MFIDVSDRKQADARRAALAELGDRLRNTADKGEIARVASEILGRTLGLSHAGYGAVDHDQETILVDQEWSAPGMPGIGGLHGFRNYGSYIESLKSGHAVIIDDVTDDPRTAPDADALKAIHVRALLNLPIMEHGRFVALLFAGDRADAASRIREWLAQGKAVILDRYVYSNVGFQCAKLPAGEERNHFHSFFCLKYYS